jgi:shikimate dehydrogenase
MRLRVTTLGTVPESMFLFRIARVSPAHPSDVYAVFGLPVAGNPTQEMVEAAFAAAGVNARYLSLTVQPRDLEQAVLGARALGFNGFNVTVPHKVAIVPLLDALTEAAELAGAVNCVKRDGDRLVGDNTDGRGFLDSLRTVLDPAGARVVVIGAGGAARAIVAELALAGAGAITIANRSVARAEEIAAAIGGRAAELTDGWAVPTDADVVVQATSVGMGDADARLPIRWGSPDGDAVAADVVFDPARTAFLDDAARAGYRTIDGLGMLVEQAVIGFRWWTGVEPDASVMRAALERELA